MSTMPTTAPGVRTSIELSEFELVDTDLGVSPDALSAADRDWIPAVVPGGVHESLVAAGRIPHPFLDRNEESIRWIEERDWWYRTSFAFDPDAAEGERVALLFHGLDTVADVWLNGRLLGRHANMFRPAEFDVTGSLEPRNEVLVRFSPPLHGLEAPASVVEMNARLAVALGAVGLDAVTAGGEVPRLLPIPFEATLRRKAAFSWGWDFGPRVPSIGVWRPAELVRVPRAALCAHHVRTDAVDAVARTASVTLRIEADESPGDTSLRAHVSLTSPSGVVSEADLPVRQGVATGALEISDAELWWTHDLGAPALYDVHISLFADDALVDERVDRIGLRTVSIDRSPDPEGGRLFRFVLNGVPLFARGAAWLPASTMVGSVTAERHRELVSLAREANMNMLRIWGGGVYEQDSFYAATDELGVLVWHDFMFACSDYPSHDADLQREVALEAEYQVARLRNRASLALWSGNNEVHLIHGYSYQDYGPGDWGWDFFHRILPEAVERLDGAVPYWPGSPWGEDPSEGFMAVNGVKDGDRHAWEVWHGVDAGAGGGDYATVGEARHYRRYAKDRGKFISEFGIHAAPALATLERWIAPDDLWVHSPSFDAHNKDHPKDKGDAILEIVTGLPETLPEYVDFTMASQAEGLKFGIEHYRRREPHCSGTLVWQFNDVWPGISWSVVDHDTVPKAGYYAVARAFSAVLASFVEEDGRLELWVSNSTPSPVSSTAVVTIAGFVGGVHLEERAPVEVGPGQSRLVWSTAVDGGDARRAAYAWVDSEDGAFGANRWFFAEPKDLLLPEPALRSVVTVTGPTTARVDIESDVFVYLVRLTVAYPSARFDDNYFDLPGGVRRSIEVSGLPAGFTAADIAVGSYLGAA